jgi:hypothetical protein
MNTHSIFAFRNPVVASARILEGRIYTWFDKLTILKVYSRHLVALVADSATWLFHLSVGNSKFPIPPTPKKRAPADKPVIRNPVVASTRVLNFYSGALGHLAFSSVSNCGIFHSAYAQKTGSGG